MAASEAQRVAAEYPRAYVLTARSCAEPVPLAGLIPLFQSGPFRSTRCGVGLRKRAAAQSFAIAVIAVPSGHDGRLSSGNDPREYGSHTISPELNLAHSHAWNLARTLMVPVIVFRVGEDEYGVLPADDLDDDEVDALFEYCPWSGARAVH